MVCKNCGSELFEEDRFCSKCGTRVTEPVSDTHSAPEEERGTEAEEMVITRFAPNAEAETEGAVAAGNGTKDGKAEKNHGAHSDIFLPHLVGGAAFVLMSRHCVHSFPSGH